MDELQLPRRKNCCLLLALPCSCQLAAAISAIAWQSALPDSRKALQIAQEHAGAAGSGLSAFFNGARNAAASLSTLQGDSGLGRSDAERTFKQFARAQDSIARPRQAGAGPWALPA